MTHLSLGAKVKVRATSPNMAPILSPQTVTITAPAGVVPTVVSATPTGTGAPRLPTIELIGSVPFLLDASKTVTLRNVTDALDVKVYNLTTDIGSGLGQIQMVNGRPQIRPPAVLADGKQYSIRWAAGAFVSWGGQVIAANTGDSVAFTVDAAPSFVTHGSIATNTTTYTYPVTYTAGRNVIGIFSQGPGGSAPLQLTMAGIAANLRARAPQSSLEYMVAIYDLVLPAGGTDDIVLTWQNGTPFRSAFALWNVGNRGFVSGSMSDSLAASPMILDMTTQVGDVAVGFGVDDAAGATFSFTGFSQNVGATVIEANHRYCAGMLASCAGGAPESLRIASSGTGDRSAAALYR